MQKNISNKEVEGEEVQMERILGVVWNIKSGTFRIKTSLKDNLATKRGTRFKLSSVHDPIGLASPFI